jgi:hypothetical protein
MRMSKDYRGFAQAGNRYPLFGIMLYRKRAAAKRGITALLPRHNRAL